MAWRAPGSGDLRERVSIMRRSSVRDDVGGIVDAWTVVATAIPAKISATSSRGGESVQAMRLSGTAPFDITVRLTAMTITISPADMVVNDRTGERMGIKWAGCLEDGRKSWLSIAAIAGEVTQ